MSKILQESMQSYMQLKLNPWKALEKYQSEYKYIFYIHMCLYILCHGSPLIARTREEGGNLGPVSQLFQLGLELVAVH